MTNTMKRVLSLVMALALVLTSAMVIAPKTASAESAELIRENLNGMTAYGLRYYNVKGPMTAIYVGKGAYLDGQFYTPYGTITKVTSSVYTAAGSLASQYWTAPYSSSFGVRTTRDAYDGKTIASGTPFKKLVAGNYQYRLVLHWGNSTRGYVDSIFTKDFKIKPYGQPTIYGLTSANVKPYNIRYGYAPYMPGDIKCTPGKITTIKMEVTGPRNFTANYTVNKSSINMETLLARTMSWSGWCSGTHSTNYIFASLPRGNYNYKLSATADNNGSRLTLSTSAKFTVY